MEGDIDRSHIMTGVRKLYLVAFLCPRVAKKHSFERMEGEFREERRVILDKNNTSKDPRRKGEVG